MCSHALPDQSWVGSPPSPRAHECLPWQTTQPPKFQQSHSNPTKINSGHPKSSESVNHCYVQFFLTPWTVTHQAPLFLGFSRQEYLPFLSPGDLPNQKSNPSLLCSGQILYHLSHQESPPRTRVNYRATRILVRVRRRAEGQPWLWSFILSLEV